MRKLIAYYSWQGHTEKVAKDLASRINAFTVKIEAEKEHSMPVKAMKAFLGLRSAIKPCKADMADVDFFVLATPVWAQRPPPYVNEYVSRLTGCSGKPFSVIVEMQSSGGEATLRKVRGRLERKGMRFVSSAITLEQDVDSGKYADAVAKLAGTIKT